MIKTVMLKDVQSRAISPENFDGAKGGGARATTGTGAHAGRELGVGNKYSPSVEIEPGETRTIAKIDGSGQINKIWMTTDVLLTRHLLLRMYWDDEESPSVEVPLADFFCDAWLAHPTFGSRTISVLPKNAYLSRWRLSFKRAARITLENVSDQRATVYYFVGYDLGEIPDDAPYFHASWRRANPLGDPADFTIIDGIQGSGQYMGTYLAMQPNADGWYGEGEFKFYYDGDVKFPTICGTGTEDYFGGSWNYDKGRGHYETYATDYEGLVYASHPDEIYKGYQRSGAYCWHLGDAIRFHEDMRVTVQAFGWQTEHRYAPLVNADIAGTSYWYQTHDIWTPQRSLADQAVDLGYANVAEYLYVAPEFKP